MSAPGVPATPPLTDCPVFLKPHCTPKDGSFGTTTVDARAVEAPASTNAAATARGSHLCERGDLGTVPPRCACGAAARRALNSGRSGWARTLGSVLKDSLSRPIAVGRTADRQKE